MVGNILTGGRTPLFQFLLLDEGFDGEVDGFVNGATCLLGCGHQCRFTVRAEV